MPANLVKSVQDKCNMSKQEAEEKWNEAKAKAKEEGHEEEYDYITQIFKHLTGQSCMKKMGWTTNESKINHLINKYLNESTHSEIMNDPLYKAVIDAKSDNERKKALETLKSIRGNDAVNVLIKYLKSKR